MANRLKNMIIKKVALVGEAANKKKFLIYKSLDYVAREELESPELIENFKNLNGKLETFKNLISDSIRKIKGVE